jgi:hypothetical protein
VKEIGYFFVEGGVVSWSVLHFPWPVAKVVCSFSQLLGHAPSQIFQSDLNISVIEIPPLLGSYADYPIVKLDGSELGD